MQIRLGRCHFFGFVTRWLQNCSKILFSAVPIPTNKLEMMVTGLQLSQVTTRKPVFGLFDQMRLKLACSATEISYRLEILHIKTTDIILSTVLFEGVFNFPPIPVGRLICPLQSYSRLLSNIICNFMIIIL